MKQELLDNALAAIDAMIADEGTATDCGRYTRIAKLAAQADKLRHMAIARVGEATQLQGGYDRYGYDLAGDLALNPDIEGGVPLLGGDLGRYIPRPIDNPMNDMLRVVSDHLDKLRLSNHKPPRAPTKSDFAEEINQLLAARDGLLAIPNQEPHMTTRGYLHPRHEQFAIIDRRIDFLLKTIDKEDSHDDDTDRNNTDDPDVVPAKLLRGYSPSGEEREGVRPGDNEADRTREGGTGEAAPAGGEQRVGFNERGLLGW